MRLFSKWFIDTKIMKTWLEFMPRGGFGHSRLIFYFWFAKLTIIKYLTPSPPTRRLSCSHKIRTTGFATARFESLTGEQAVKKFFKTPF